MSGPSWRASCHRRETDDSQSATAAAISSGYEVTKEEARRRQVPQLARIDSALAHLGTMRLPIRERQRPRP
jgi:hypothetical protein